MSIPFLRAVGDDTWIWFLKMVPDSYETPMDGISREQVLSNLPMLADTYYVWAYNDKLGRVVGITNEAYKNASIPMKAYFALVRSMASGERGFKKLTKPPEDDSFPWVVVGSGVVGGLVSNFLPPGWATVGRVAGFGIAGTSAIRWVANRNPFTLFGNK